MTTQELDRVIREYICAECGAGLVTPWSSILNKIILVCSKDRSHRGYTRYDHVIDRLNSMRSGTNDEEINNLMQAHQIQRQLTYGRKFMVQNASLEKYNHTTALTRESANEILKTIWPKAPEPERLKAALTCVAYQLNPLMRHLYLIPYKNTQTQEITWAQVLGIGAIRLMASRRKPYSYVDGPRVMSDEEQQKIFGKIDALNIVAITVVADMNNMRAPGYGRWPKASAAKGADKGNTQENMAFIRSERAALDRLLPGEMPSEIEVMDEKFMPEIKVTAPEAGNTNASTDVQEQSQWRNL